jgi:probable F420-dependent oxidoreductase
MKFGAALPTCAEGLGYPLGFASADGLARIAEHAEALGFYAVMANDHVCTPRSIRDRFAHPPNFYEPLITLASCAARTSRIRLMTGVVVLPLREPVLLAKQLTTLDQCCHGRLLAGVGPGAYRDEFESALPRLRHASRADLMDEAVEALSLLLRRPRATFTSRHYAFDDVELYPKAAQPELPLFIGGNTERAIRRAGRYGAGWLPASLSSQQLARGKALLGRYAEEAGRDPTRLSVATQLVVCIGRTQQEAEERFKASQVYQEWTTVGLSGVALTDFLGANLIGTPAEICHRVAVLERAGVDHLAGLIFPGNDVNEVLEQMDQFGESVVKVFAGSASESSAGAPPTSAATTSSAKARS